MIVVVIGHDHRHVGGEAFRAGVIVGVYLSRRAVVVELDLAAHGIPGAVPHPELDGVVVAARREHVPNWVPPQVPDSSALVRVLDLGVRFIQADDPIDELPVISSAGEKTFMLRVPRQSCHVMPVTLERTHILHGADVVELDRLISGARHQPISIFVPCYLDHSVLVSVEGGETVPGAGVPELDQVVLTARHDERLERMPLHRFHVPAVAGQRSLLFIVLPVPYTHRGIVGTRSELGIRRPEAQASDGVGTVSQEMPNRRHRRLPVLDYPIVISGDERVTGVTPSHRTDGALVSLKDSDEIERSVFPQSKLSARVSCNAARYSFGGPRQTEDRTPLLIGRGFHPLRANTRRRVQPRRRRW